MEKSKKEKLLEYHRNWRQRNKETIKATHKRWRDRNKKQLVERNRLWRKNNPERAKELSDAYWAKNKDRVNAKRRTSLNDVARRYGLTSEEYAALLEKQNNVCAICKLPPKPEQRLSVDHCHSTNKVRGLLHRECNSLLGMCGDKVNVLKNAIAYLEEHAESKSDTSET